MEAIPVTDWIQVILSLGTFIVSIAGLFYVALTLREQSRVNAAQFELLKIENKRARREIRPIISIESVETKPPLPGYFNRHVNFSYVLRCHDNAAYGVAFEYLRLPGTGHYSDVLRPGKGIVRLLPGDSIEFVVQQVHSMETVMILRVHFKDIDSGAIKEDFEIFATSVKPYNDSIETPYTPVNKIHSSVNFLMTPLSPDELIDGFQDRPFERILPWPNQRQADV